MNVKQQIRCNYCDATARPLHGQIGIPRFKGWTRYGCDNRHYFAVPTHTVAVRLKKAA